MNRIQLAPGQDPVAGSLNGSKPRGSTQRGQFVD
jgi:hypothetical protein